jgi:hypothetical protein
VGWLCSCRMGLAEGLLTAIPQFELCSNAVTRFHELSYIYGIVAITSYAFPNTCFRCSMAPSVEPGKRVSKRLWISRLRGGGDECAKKPCAPHRYDSAQTGHLRCPWVCEGPASDQDIKAVPESEQKSLLGQQFSVSVLLY